jgi:hypothetical protein
MRAMMARAAERRAVSQLEWRHETEGIRPSEYIFTWQSVFFDGVEWLAEPGQ